MYPSPTSETIEESRRLELNGPITAAASKPPLPASHNELNDLFHRTHFCHSNPVSHSAPKHNYCHSGSREAKCLLLVIYASVFLSCVCVCMCGCVFPARRGGIYLSRSKALMLLPSLFVHIQLNLKVVCQWVHVC